MVAVDQPGRRWKKYSLTPQGQQKAREAVAALDPAYREWMGRLRPFLTTRSFAKLLDDVYEAFPE